MKSETIPITQSGVRLEELIDKTIQHMKQLGYSPNTFINCRCIWRRLSRLDDAEVFSPELIKRYLKSEGIPEDALTDYSKVDPKRRRILSALKILNHYALYGCLPSRRYSPKVEQLPGKFEKILEVYGNYCFEERGLSANTVHYHKYQVRKLLSFLTDHLGDELIELQAKHLSAFFDERYHWKPAEIARVASSLKSFLQYLWVSNILSKDLTQALPKVRIWRDAHIPTVWNQNETKAILSAIDRSSSKGKRDYAILLLASRLGLRSCDIRKLKLDNLNWAESRIEIIQAKTKEPLVLPLMEDIGEAIIDYLRYGRPKNKYREVFLRVNAPFTPFVSSSALYTILNFYRRRAKVTARRGHRGIHSLRYTVATRMLKKNIPVEVISAILGHVSVESTHIYTKVDIKALRSAALNPEDLKRKEVQYVS